MRARYKTYRLRTSNHPWYKGERIFVLCRGYRDAIKLHKIYSGRII